MGLVVYSRKLRSGADDCGAIAIIVALLAVTLFGFAALVVDIGNAYNVREQGQSTVDAASLAGVQALETTSGSIPAAVDAVESYVRQNMGITDLTGCTDNPAPLVPTDPDTCISTSAAGVTPYRVRVRLPTQHVQATFGGLFGVSSIAISPVATAQWGQTPPACGPCDPAPPKDLPFTLPDPASVPLAPDPDPNGCPAGPGRFTTDVLVLTGTACTLHPGLYVFDNSSLDVEVGANIASTLSGGVGVTLAFFGTGTLTVDGRIGIVDPPVQPGQPPLLSALTASDPSVPSVPPLSGQPIPGVAIVFDQAAGPRTFTLGDRFDITGSVWAIDGQTTWATENGDCPAVGSLCVVNSFSNSPPSMIETTKTVFAENGRIPTVAPASSTGPGLSPRPILVQ